MHGLCGIRTAFPNFSTIPPNSKPLSFLTSFILAAHGAQVEGGELVLIKGRAGRRNLPQFPLPYKEASCPTSQLDLPVSKALGYSRGHTSRVTALMGEMR